MGVLSRDYSSKVLSGFNTMSTMHVQDNFAVAKDSNHIPVRQQYI